MVPVDVQVVPCLLRVDHDAGQTVQPRRADECLGALLSRTATPIEPWRSAVSASVRRASSLHLPPCRPEDEGLPTSTVWNRGALSRAAGRSHRGALGHQRPRTGQNQSPAAVAEGCMAPALRPVAGTPAPGEDDDRSALRCRVPVRPRAAHPPWSATAAPNRSPSVPPFCGQSCPLAPPPSEPALEHVDHSTAGRSRRTDDQEVLLRGEAREPNPSPSVPSFAPSIPLSTQPAPCATEDVDGGRREWRASGSPPGSPGARSRSVPRGDGGRPSEADRRRGRVPGGLGGEPRQV